MKVRKLSNLVACDTETTGLNPWLGDRPWAVSFFDDEGREDYFSFPVDPFTREVLYHKRPQDWRRLKSIFEARDRRFVFFNAKFDTRQLEFAEVDVPWQESKDSRIEESMFAVHAVDPAAFTGLKPLAERFCGISQDDQRDLKQAVIRARKVAKKKGWKIHKEVPPDYWLCPDEGKVYACKDAERTMLLWLLFSPLLDEVGVRHIYDEEMRLWPVTYQMETRGMSVSMPQLQEDIDQANNDLTECEAQWQSLAPEVENINSPKQLSHYFFKTQGIKCEKYTDKGNPSVTGRVLEGMDHPLARVIVRTRAKEKLLSSFLEKYATLSAWDGKTWRLHPDLMQQGTITGRYSCRNPNMQNVANAQTTRSTEPIQARSCLGPAPDHIWWHFDYSQMEVRIFAWLAQEPFMLQAIKDGVDFHTACANKAWGGYDNGRAIKAAIHALGLDDSSVETEGIAGEAGVSRTSTKAMKVSLAELWLKEYGGDNWDIVAAEKTLGKKTSRSKAKLLLFLKIYGGGPNAASDVIGCAHRDAVRFLYDYDSAFPRIPEFMDEVTSQARHEGFVLTEQGSRVTVDREVAYRGVNYRIQGTAARLLKNRTVATYEWVKAAGILGLWWPVMTVHDELIWEVEKRRANRMGIVKKVKAIMEDHGGVIGIPLPVDAAYATSRWDQKTAVTL